MKTDFILADFRKPVVAPKWWEGHVIHYKEHPLEGGVGLSTLNLSARDGGKQLAPPYDIGKSVSVIVGGERMRGEVYRIAIHPKWRDELEFDTAQAEWVITVCFPRIPKKHLQYP
jgi:hypothetical protein